MFGRRWRKNRKHRHVKFNPGGKFHATANTFLFSIFPKCSILPLNENDVKCISCFRCVFCIFTISFSIMVKNLSLVLLLSPLLENMFVVMLYARGVALDIFSSPSTPKTSRLLSLKRNLSIFSDKKRSFNLPCLSINYWRKSLPPAHITTVKKH